MARREVIVPPNELADKIEELSKGEGIVLVEGSDWKLLEAAYNSRLMASIMRRSIGVFPIRSVPHKELTFRLLIED